MTTAGRKFNGTTLWPAIALLLGSMMLAAGDAPPAEQHYQAARAALAKRDTGKAKRELRLALQSDPLHSQAHFLLAQLLGREGDLDQAIVGFQQAVTLDPNNAMARYNLGTALLYRGEPIAAARQFEDAIMIRPEYVPTYNNLAKAYFLAGIPELSVACYREALRLEASNPVALKGLAVLTRAESAPSKPGTERGDANKPGRNPPSVEAKQPVVPAKEREALPAAEVQSLQEVIRDLPHVTVEQRGGRLALSGWTSGATERTLLDRVLAARKDLLDLTSDDVGDSNRLLEVDAVLLTVRALDSLSVGHNFLDQVTVNAKITQASAAAFSWLYSAEINYVVNIANAAESRIAFLARPHLTTLSGTPASFIAGGDVVYKVSGTTSGDIKPYPFGTELVVTPTLLRTRSEDGGERIRLSVKTGRKSILPLTDTQVQAANSTVFDNISVTSEAVLALNQTLILSGLTQRERQTTRSGIPILRDIPIIKYLFSVKVTSSVDLAIIMLLTPRDPAFWDEHYRQDVAAFVEKRRAFIQAEQGTEEDLRRFKERYPDWNQLAPNRFVSHFVLLKNSEVYRRVSGIDLANENLDFDALGAKQDDKKPQDK